MAKPRKAAAAAKPAQTVPPAGPDPVAGKAYPRPLLVRPDWTNLNGTWQFAIDADARCTRSTEATFDRTILVPYAPETPASGVGDTGFYDAVWYRRTFTPSPMNAGDRLLLHFGAVDWSARVWVNDQLAAEHDGGYTPFVADVTDLLTAAGEQTITVRAHDDPHDMAKPRGKQDWHKDAHSIWYPRTTGIWQTVWAEVVPARRVDHLRWTPDFEGWTIRLQATVVDAKAGGLRLRVKLSFKGAVLADDTYAVDAGGHVDRTIRLPDPGIDDARFPMAWWPHDPNLFDATLTLLDGDGRTVDAVTSYTAMRGVSLRGGQFFLNGRPYTPQLVLDQGYWPETGLTAPDDAALKKDVELVKALGFNGVRKHQKVEDPRFLYWADHLGLLVWGEAPGAYAFEPRAIERQTKLWAEAVARDVSHPCVVTWMPFNESWGVPDLPRVAAQRAFVAALYQWTRAYDPTRPVVGNDGWEAGGNATDIVGVHDYDADPARMVRRYDRANLPDLFDHERPGNRVVVLDDFEYAGEPAMLTEFGGIAYTKLPGAWGYSTADSAEAFAARYYRLMSAVRSMPLLAGWCYTQFTDTYQEANGLVYMDRTPKVAAAELAVATRGPRNNDERAIEAKLKAAK